MKHFKCTVDGVKFNNKKVLKLSTPLVEESVVEIKTYKPTIDSIRSLANATNPNLQGEYDENERPNEFLNQMADIETEIKKEKTKVNNELKATAKSKSAIKKAKSNAEKSKTSDKEEMKALAEEIAKAIKG